MNKLAVVFPGIGYTVDKPLLHYSRRLAAAMGYEIRLLPYAGFPKKVIGDRSRMEESYMIALQQTREMLSDIDFSSCDDILFIGKSIGTIVAAQLAQEISGKYSKHLRLVLYTPLKDTFSFAFEDAVCFTGSADQWVRDSSEIQEQCRKRGISCHIIENANHSLETGDVLKDVKNMKKIMQETARFLGMEA